MALGWGMGRMGVTANGCGVSAWGDEDALKLITGMVIQPYERVTKH